MRAAGLFLGAVLPPSHRRVGKGLGDAACGDARDCRLPIAASQWPLVASVVAHAVAAGPRRVLTVLEGTRFGGQHAHLTGRSTTPFLAHSPGRSATAQLKSP